MKKVSAAKRNAAAKKTGVKNVGIGEPSAKGAAANAAQAKGSASKRAKAHRSGSEKSQAKKSHAQNNLTELVFILDRSGSMSGLEDDTIGGFNSMIAKQKKIKGTAFVSTVLFDNVNEVLHDRVKLSEVPPMTYRDYFTRGCTALYDAVGDAVHHIMNIHKYARPEDVPARTLFVITTDGMENASRRYTQEAVRDLIREQKEQHKWEFIFIGANINAEETAEGIGIERKRAVNYHCDGQGTEKVFEAVCEAARAVREYEPEEYGEARLCECACSALDCCEDSWREELDRDYRSR